MLKRLDDYVYVGIPTSNFFTKRKRTITIQNNEASDLTDYQVCIEISDTDFFTKADPNNLVIADKGVILPYWVETWKRPDGKARIWTKVNLPASGSKTIDLYYDGYTSKTQQDGDSVFEFFDDFDSDTLDANKWIWTSNNDATFICDNSILTIHLAPTSDSNYYAWLKCKESLQQGISFFTAMKVTHLFSPSPDLEMTGVELCINYHKENNNNLFMYNKVVSNQYKSDGYINNEWTLPKGFHSRMSSEPLPVIKDINKILKIHYRDSYYDSLDNTEYNSYNYSEDYEDRRVQIGLYHPKTDSDAVAKIDWIYVAKLTDNPPSISISSEIEEKHYWN